MHRHTEESQLSRHSRFVSHFQKVDLNFGQGHRALTGQSLIGSKGGWLLAYRSPRTCAAATRACPRASPPSLAGVLVWIKTGTPLRASSVRSSNRAF